MMMCPRRICGDFTPLAAPFKRRASSGYFFLKVELRSAIKLLAALCLSVSSGLLWLHCLSLLPLDRCRRALCLWPQRIRAAGSRPHAQCLHARPRRAARFSNTKLYSCVPNQCRCRCRWLALLAVLCLGEWSVVGLLGKAVLNHPSLLNNSSLAALIGFFTDSLSIGDSDGIQVGD